MTRHPWLLIALFLSSCGSLPKAGPQAALYDFGIGTAAPDIALTNIRVTSIEAGPGLDGSGMRYRLAYQNPARVYTFTESRWVSSPEKLLAGRLQQRLQASGEGNCSLIITLDAFDQIFDQPDRSHALVQMHAILKRGSGRQSIIQSFQAKAEHAADSADARGGVAALVTASDHALAEIAGWATRQGCSHLTDQN